MEMNSVVRAGIQILLIVINVVPTPDGISSIKGIPMNYLPRSQNFH